MMHASGTSTRRHSCGAISVARSCKTSQLASARILRCCSKARELSRVSVVRGMRISRAFAEAAIAELASFDRPHELRSIAAYVIERTH